MPSIATAALGFALALVACAAVAQPAQPAPAASAAPASKPHVKVIEDDNVRIEETRTRGNTVSKIVVKNKVPAARDYEIEVAPAGRDRSQEKGNAGKSAWSVLTF